MSTETLRVVRDILIRAAIVTVGFALLLLIAIVASWHSIVAMVHGIKWEEAALADHAVTFFRELKFYLIFFLIVPAIAIHWTMQKELTKSAAAPKTE